MLRGGGARVADRDRPGRHNAAPSSDITSFSSSSALSIGFNHPPKK
jgi:hypothetical protein